MAPGDCPPLVPGPPTLPEPRSTPARPCPRPPSTTQPCSQPPDNGPRAQTKPCQKSASATVSTLILHQMRMETTAAAAAHAQVDLDTPSNWRPRAPRAPMPSPACARKGETGCRIPCRVASGCWEGVKAPPYLQTRPDHAPRPFPHPHRAPWRRVSGARGRANLRAAKLHLACGASLTHDLAARLPIRRCSRRRRSALAH